MVKLSSMQNWFEQSNFRNGSNVYQLLIIINSETHHLAANYRLHPSWNFYSCILLVEIRWGANLPNSMNLVAYYAPQSCCLVPKMRTPAPYVALLTLWRICYGMPLEILLKLRQPRFPTPLLENAFSYPIVYQLLLVVDIWLTTPSDFQCIRKSWMSNPDQSSIYRHSWALCWPKLSGGTLGTSRKDTP